jgi:glycosyltransferase involved in cell wall biosynthesis
MEPTKSICIGVLTHNSKGHLPDLFASLLSQSPRTQLSLIFVDNQSTDETIKELQTFKSTHLGQYCDIQVILNSKNNIATGRNLILRNTSADFVAFVDSDCKFSANWLIELESGFDFGRLQNNKQIAYAGSQKFPSNGRFYQILDLMQNSFLGHGKSPQAMRPQKSRLVNHVPCTNVLFERKKLLEVGGFDDSFALCGEDREISAKLKSYGHELAMGPLPWVINDCAPDFLSWLKRMFRFGSVQPEFLKLSTFVANAHGPSVLGLLSIMTFIFLALFPQLILPFVVIYLLIILFEATRVTIINKGIKFENLYFATRVSLMLFFTHLSYFIGFAFGFVYRMSRSIMPARRPFISSQSERFGS